MSRPPNRSDYAVLGLRPGAGDDEIRDAYRRLAKVHHPDRNPGDPQALAIFARLSESYAALRGRERARASPAAGRRTSRRDPGVAPLVLADLPLGGAAWVAADAVLVGPGRFAALRPSAAGSAFPSADHVIRVERRPDGHHVFMPPQPSARWRLSDAAETEGLAVAALWVGDRQDRDAAPTVGARLPLRLMTDTVADLLPGAAGWVAAEALGVDAEGNWSLDSAEPVGRTPHRDTPVRVLRDAGGYRVRCELPAAAWAPAGPPTPGRVAVVAAELGQEPPAPSGS